MRLTASFHFSDPARCVGFRCMAGFFFTSYIGNFICMYSGRQSKTTRTNSNGGSLRLTALVRKTGGELWLESQTTRTYRDRVVEIWILGPTVMSPWAPTPLARRKTKGILILSQNEIEGVCIFIPRSLHEEKGDACGTSEKSTYSVVRNNLRKPTSSACFFGMSNRKGLSLLPPQPTPSSPLGLSGAPPVSRPAVAVGGS